MFRFLTLYLIFGLIITYSWRYYEKVKFGTITPDTFDSVICVILALSLTTNVFLIYYWLKN